MCFPSNCEESGRLLFDLNGNPKEGEDRYRGQDRKRFKVLFRLCGVSNCVRALYTTMFSVSSESVPCVLW